MITSGNGRRKFRTAEIASFIHEDVAQVIHLLVNLVRSGDSAGHFLAHEDSEALPQAMDLRLERRQTDGQLRGGVLVAWRLKCSRQESLKDRSEERRVGKECRSRWSPY